MFFTSAILFQRLVDIGRYLRPTWKYQAGHMHLDGRGKVLDRKQVEIGRGEEEA